MLPNWYLAEDVSEDSQRPQSQAQDPLSFTRDYPQRMPCDVDTSRSYQAFPLHEAPRWFSKGP